MKQYDLFQKELDALKKSNRRWLDSNSLFWVAWGLTLVLIFWSATAQ